MWDGWDDYEKLWLYFAWIQKKESELERLRNHAIMIGSFTNPEAAKQMISGPTYSSSDEDVELAMETVRAAADAELKRIEDESKKRKTRRNAKRKVITDA